MTPWSDSPGPLMKLIVSDVTAIWALLISDYFQSGLIRTRQGPDDGLLMTEVTLHYVTPIEHL
nr:hypothetical protein GCM10010200_002200 [Actinomadura rugatobispora]